MEEVDANPLEPESAASPPIERSSPAPSSSERASTSSKKRGKKQRETDELMEAFDRLVDKSDAEKKTLSQYACAIIPEMELVDPKFHSQMKVDVLKLIIDYQNKSNQQTQNLTQSSIPSQMQPLNYTHNQYGYPMGPRVAPLNQFGQGNPTFPPQPQHRPPNQGPWGQVAVQSVMGRPHPTGASAPLAHAGWCSPTSSSTGMDADDETGEHSPLLFHNF